MRDTQSTTQLAEPSPRSRGTKATSGRTTAPKKDRLKALLARPKGATMTQLEKSLGWQAHTVRAAISRLRKNGADVTLDRSGKTPAYRITGAS